jgi:hypothetical protein
MFAAITRDSGRLRATVACVTATSSAMNFRMTRRFIQFACGLVGLALTACSNFDSRFAQGSNATRKGDGFAGTYEGKWTSSSHPGSGGKLWCILTKQRENEYLAEFKATWHGVFSSTHSVVLQGKSRPSKGRAAPVLALAGTSEIRMFVGAGTYRCEGQTDGRRMQACYDATYDRGTFDLLRVPPSHP